MANQPDHPDEQHRLDGTAARRLGRIHQPLHRQGGSLGSLGWTAKAYGQ